MNPSRALQILVLFSSSNALAQPSDLPPELLTNSRQFTLESSAREQTTLLSTKSSRIVRVGTDLSTPIVEQVASQEVARERMKGIDWGGGLWNTVFGGSGEFKSSKDQVAGLVSSMLEFSMKRKKQITGTTQSIIHYSYDVTVRNRSSTTSTMKQVFSRNDTLAVISQIGMTGDTTNWQMEFLLTRGELVLVQGKILQAPTEYTFMYCKACKMSDSIILLKDQKMVAGIDFGLFPRLFIDKTIDQRDSDMIICAAAVLYEAFQLASTAY